MGGVVKVKIYEVDMKMALMSTQNDYAIKVDIEHCTLGPHIFTRMLRLTFTVIFCRPKHQSENVST